MTLLERIESRRAVICVIGAGYVGLPLAVAFAESGFGVVVIDIDPKRVESINSGVSYLSDVSSERVSSLLKGSAGTLSATTDSSPLAKADVAVVCVPTPLSKMKDPDLSYVVSAADEIAARLHPEMLVVLESTTYPGSTEEVILPRLETNNSGNFKVGEDFYLAFSPERIDPGRSDYKLENTPKVLGGVTERCLAVAEALYQTAVNTVVPVTSPRVAEMVKLLENTFRATNIALVNEIAIMCDHLGVSVWEVISAAETKPFGFMPFYPGPGLGGHCLPVDPQYLAWKLRTLNYNARFINLAEEVNLGMPGHVVGKINDALNDVRKPMKGSAILVLGVAYKADVGDTRESPALDVIERLREKGADVSYHDPYVPEVEMEGFELSAIELTDAALNAADCVVVLTAHSEYDWNWIVANSSLVLDTRNATKGVESRAIVKL